MRNNITLGSKAIRELLDTYTLIIGMNSERKKKNIAIGMEVKDMHVKEEKTNVIDLSTHKKFLLKNG